MSPGIKYQPQSKTSLGETSYVFPGQYHFARISSPIYSNADIVWLYFS